MALGEGGILAVVDAVTFCYLFCSFGACGNAAAREKISISGNNKFKKVFFPVSY